MKITEVPEAVQPKQTDHSRCFACRKKIGLLGYRCKSCDCSYCSNHRIPEDHSCEGNFVEEARNALKKNNTVVAAPKIEQI